MAAPHFSFPPSPSLRQPPVPYGRAADGPAAFLAADEDLGEAARAGRAVQRLAAEGGPHLLRADLRLPRQHMALAEEMTFCAPAHREQGRILAHLLANSKTVCFF